jgi:hypothetical protein
MVTSCVELSMVCSIVVRYLGINHTKRFENTHVLAVKSTLKLNIFSSREDIVRPSLCSI